MAQRYDGHFYFGLSFFLFADGKASWSTIDSHRIRAVSWSYHVKKCCKSVEKVEFWATRRTVVLETKCFTPKLLRAKPHSVQNLVEKRCSKETFDHTRLPTLRFHINCLATVQPTKTRTNVEYRSWAAQLENDETTKRVFLPPPPPPSSECHIRCTLR